MENDDSIEALQKLIDQASQWATRLTKGVELVKSASELAGQAVEIGRDTTMVIRRWRETTVAQVPFEVRKVQKEEFISKALAKTGDHVRANQGALQNVPSLLTNIFSGGFDPFSGLVVSSVVTLVDGYLTRKTLRQGFSLVNSTLQEGFQSLVTAVDGGFKDLSSTFTWGAAELMWRMDQQTSLAKTIAEALTRPLETQVRELRERAIKSYNYGWYDEALSDLLDAMAKARVDYIVAQYLGNVYLFHKRDYPKAIEYYQKAARYSEPESRPHSAIAWMHLGLAHYFAAGEERDRMQHFQSAAECVANAQALAPSWIDLYYQLAQYNALANNPEASLNAIRILLDNQPLYILKIASEEDFAGLRDGIAEIVDEMHHRLVRSLAHRIDRHKAFMVTLAGHYGEYFDRQEVRTYLSTLEVISLLLASGDFVSVVRAGELEAALQLPLAKSKPRRPSFPHGYRPAYFYAVRSSTFRPYESSWPIGGELL